MKRRLLFALPLLLLAPLGVLKWRADWIQDHPPLSKMDKQFRAKVSRASVVYITGYGTFWERQAGESGLPPLKGRAIAVRDKVALQELATTLHCTDVPNSPNFPRASGCIVVGFSDSTLAAPRLMPASRIHVAKQMFFYNRGETSAIVNMIDFGLEDKQTVPYARVRPRFMPQFEACIARLVRRALATGQHPEVVLKSSSDFASSS